MQNIKGEKLNLCPNNKKNCIFNEKQWRTGKPKKCFDCLKKYTGGDVITLKINNVKFV